MFTFQMISCDFLMRQSSFECDAIQIRPTRISGGGDGDGDGDGGVLNFSHMFRTKNCQKILGFWIINVLEMLLLPLDSHLVNLPATNLLKKRLILTANHCFALKQRGQAHSP